MMQVAETDGRMEAQPRSQIDGKVAPNEGGRLAISNDSRVMFVFKVMRPWDRIGAQNLYSRFRLILGKLPTKFGVLEGIAPRIPSALVL